MTIFHLRRISYQTSLILMMGKLTLSHWNLIQTLNESDEFPIEEVQNLSTIIKSAVSLSLNFDKEDRLYTDQVETNAEYCDFMDDKKLLEESFLDVADDLDFQLNSLEQYLKLNEPYLVYGDFVASNINQLYVFITLICYNKIIVFFYRFCSWGARPRQWPTYNFHLIGPKDYTFQIHSEINKMNYNIFLLEKFSDLAMFYGISMEDLLIDDEIPVYSFQALISSFENLIFSSQNYDVSTWKKEDADFKFALEENLLILAQSFNSCLAETNNLLGRADIITLLGETSAFDSKHIYLCTLVVHYAQLQGIISSFIDDGLPGADLSD